jgi:hypothetical protein
MGYIKERISLLPIRVVLNIVLFDAVTFDTDTFDIDVAGTLFDIVCWKLL